MHDLDSFSRDYATARAKFLAAARNHNMRMESFLHKDRAPDGTELAVDCVCIGPRDAARLLIIISGTHGVEGLAGSACQTDWLRREFSLPADTSVLLIHTLNPYGVAWRRRVNEDNVDLNRNFINHDTGGIDNPCYAALHDLLIPTTYNGPGRIAAEAKLEEAREQLGEEAFQIALLGQSSHPNGFYYSGTQAVWSNRVLHEILDEHASIRRAVAVIDLHTGLGPYGYGLVGIANHPNSPETDLAREWYGEAMTTFHDVGQQFGYPDYSSLVDGLVISGIRRALPDIWVIAGGIEFGTYSMDVIQDAERSDAWLHSYGQNASPDIEEQIRSELLRVYCPFKRDWQEMILARSAQVLNQSIHGLSKISV